MKKAGIRTADLDARLLLGHVLNKDQLQLIAGEKDKVPAPMLKEFEALVARRLSGEPVARIFGEKEFYGLMFSLNEATLVPRPETELLVDLGIKILSGRHGVRVLDLGTGSGCIGICLAANLPHCEVVGGDISQKALEVARINARSHDVQERVRFVRGAWFEPIGEEEKFDLIISNPPYIAGKEIRTLAREVREHDPVRALDGGIDGLDAYRDIIGLAGKHLNVQGELLLEIGHDQNENVGELCRKAGFDLVEEYCDLAGHVRVIKASC
ncbi:Peptide chain release factor N(5)-glutamine methyltransferase [hydrothermal vent metagenome]|uniref:peptide chain release factor N(5)-glutamine methyltransferase n=1 Tax=hydrothermal vent metagenome TaxID=652676 RepID=A0A3B0UA83_9ZZZZ